MYMYILLQHYLPHMNKLNITESANAVYFPENYLVKTDFKRNKVKRVKKNKNRRSILEATVVRFERRKNSQRGRYHYSILSHNLGSHRGTTDEFAKIPFFLVLFSAALVELSPFLSTI